MGKKTKKQKDQIFANVMADKVRRQISFARSMTDKAANGVAAREVEVHMILLNALLNQENNMKSAGIKIPDDYVEDRVEAKWEKGGTIDPNWVPCRRCEFCKKLDDGNYRCTEFFTGPRREVYIVSSDDGCSRGLLKEEYR